MAVRCIPRDRRSLDETRSKPGHLRSYHRTMRRNVCEGTTCTFRRRAIIPGGGSRWRRQRNCLPLPVIPLADVAGPVLNRYIDGLAIDLEGCFLVSSVRGSKQVESVETALRQSNRLTARGHRTRLGLGCRREFKVNAVVRDYCWQQLCW